MKLLKKIDEYLCKLEDKRNSLSNKEREKVYIKGCIFAISFLVIGLLLTGCSSDFNVSIQKGNKTYVGNGQSDYNLNITFIDIGQGDAIYLESNGENMLVDTGSSDNERDLLEFLEEKNIDEIDYLVCTHMHEDHIGNADNVLTKYKVNNIYLSTTNTDTKAFDNLEDSVRLEFGAEILYPEEGYIFYFGTCKITVLSAERVSDLNNSSIVLLVENNEDYILLTGDAEAEIEKELVKEYSDLLREVDLLKIGHHGSYNASCEEFISTITPLYSVISCGVNNSYGHPHSQTMETLNKYEIEIFITTDGDISFYSDGNSIIRN